MDAHRVEVLDRADDDGVVSAVAHQLELELVPAEQRLLDEHLADRALGERALQQTLELLGRPRRAAAVPAERERRPQDHRQGQTLGHVLRRRDDRRLRHPQARREHGLAEALAVLGALDDVDRRPDQLDAEIVEDALLGERDGEVERGLAAHRRQQRVGPLALEHARDALEVERLEVRAVGEPGVGHDRRRVRVDDDRPEPVLPQHLQRLAARVVELAGLPDHDRPGADQADRLDVTPPWQGRSPPRPTTRGSPRRRAARGLPPDGTGRSAPRSLRSSSPSTVPS